MSVRQTISGGADTGVAAHTSRPLLPDSRFRTSTTTSLGAIPIDIASVAEAPARLPESAAEADRARAELELRPGVMVPAQIAARSRRILRVGQAQSVTLTSGAWNRKPPKRLATRARRPLGPIGTFYQVGKAIDGGRQRARLVAARADQRRCHLHTWQCRYPLPATQVPLRCMLSI